MVVDLLVIYHQLTVGVLFDRSRQLEENIEQFISFDQTTCFNFEAAVVTSCNLTQENSVVDVIVPTFDTKVTEYLCSGCVFFFFRQISTL